MSSPDCVACLLNADPSGAPGGRILSTERWVLEHIVAPIPLVGWLILRTVRHTEGIVGLDPAEGAELGRLLATLPKMLQEVSGAEQVYVCVFTEVVPHLHIHLIPRLPDQAVRGPQLFVERMQAIREHPESSPPAAEAAAFVARVKAALLAGLGDLEG